MLGRIENTRKIPEAEHAWCVLEIVRLLQWLDQEWEDEIKSQNRPWRGFECYSESDEKPLVGGGQSGDIICCYVP